MDLDNYREFAGIDPENMLAHIEGLPDQLEHAWQLGGSLPLPDWRGIQRVLIAGMGGSAIGADLLTAYAAPHLRVPVLIRRDYDLPGWASGPETLVIASSHSGNTEETLSAFERGRSSGCRLMAISTGGRLGQAARDAGLPAWEYAHTGQPRAAVGFSFALLLAVFARLDLIPAPADELGEAVQAMRAQQSNLAPKVPVVKNPAKRMAGQLYGRIVTVFGADALEPVARRWKTQINEIAKAWAQFEALPEADHNTLEGVANPTENLAQVMALFLRAPSYHPRNQLRTDQTKTIMMLEGLNTDFIDAGGNSRLAHQWTALHFGDYTAYYLAMAYGVDPTPVEHLADLKNVMAKA
jgi:glucose/mannose-6-phosphate isomerase